VNLSAEKSARRKARQTWQEPRDKGIASAGFES
jgi:hypothetical protein